MVETYVELQSLEPLHDKRSVGGLWMVTTRVASAPACHQRVAAACSAPVASSLRYTSGRSQIRIHQLHPVSDETDTQVTQGWHLKYCLMSGKSLWNACGLQEGTPGHFLQDLTGARLVKFTRFLWSYPCG